MSFPIQLIRTGLLIHWKKYVPFFILFLSFSLSFSLTYDLYVRACVSVCSNGSVGSLNFSVLFCTHTHTIFTIFYFVSIVLLLMYVLFIYDKVRIAKQLKCDCQVSKRVFATYKTVIVSFSLICFREYYILYTCTVLRVFDIVVYVCYKHCYR